MTYEMDGQVGLFAQDTWSGKTSMELGQAEIQKEQTSRQSSKKQSVSSSQKPPLCLCLKRDGQAQDAYTMKWEDGALLGEFTTHSFGVSPKEENASRLSQILEDCPHPKYCLSGRACIGILNRANKRGKELPYALREALILTIAREAKEYGEAGIADTIEILRKMREEVGAEDLKEWAKRAFVLVQQTEILLSDVCEPLKDGSRNNERELVERDSEKNRGETEVRAMRVNHTFGNSPQRREPNEQFQRKLDLLMQKLPCEAAQKEIVLYCLRAACKSERTLLKTLSTNESENEKRKNANTVVIEGNGARNSHKGDGYKESETSYTLNTVEQHAVAYCLDQQGGKGAANYAEDVSCPILSDSHGTPHAVCQNKQYKGGDCIAFKPQNGAKARGIGEQKECSPTLSSSPCGFISPAVAYNIGSYTSNAWKSDNPNSGVYETDVSKTLDALNCGAPVCNQGGTAIVEPILLESNQNHATVQTDGICTALPASMGMGGGTENAETNGTLQAKESGGTSLNLNNVCRQQSVVRRLTPLECERLQDFPDGWTDIGDWVDEKGKVHKTADSQRYKALGNSIALPFWFYLLRRISAQYERPATLGSLFSGIGGFELCWERCNGKGTARWASEIEPFCIAVTKHHFEEG